ncbi:MAG: carbonic anhydrase family protein [Candidatus Thiodiazotropha sp.]
MNKHLLSALAAGLLASSASQAADKAHWGYTGHEGPDNWGELSPDYALCASGKNQSPINLTDMVEGGLPALSIDYKPGGFEVINNGHTIQVNYAPGSSLTVDGHRFELKQFHFHAPSENRIEGRAFPMEAHFVHADSDGNLAVIAVMYENGEANPELARAWQVMPHDAGGSHPLNNRVDANALLPKDRDYYRFNGSLTTPPCSEGVTWIVMKTPEKATAEQIEAFSHTMHHDNNRPTQPLNARVVIQ